MKKWLAVEVQWLDSHGGDLDWGKLTAKHGRTEPIVTVGQLYSDTDEGVTIALSRDARQNVDCYIFIPRVSIVRQRNLR